MKIWLSLVNFRKKTKYRVRQFHKVSIYVIVLLSGSNYLHAQQEKLEIDGAIQISDAEDINTDPGTIRWTGSDFEGWNGVTWMTLTGRPIGSVTDMDGNTYKTMQIGDNEWMLENLRTSRYFSNQSIAQVTDQTQWSGLNSAAWCWYNNDDSYDIPYGKLYNAFAVNSGLLCPTGWKIPSKSDFDNLAVWRFFSEAPWKQGEN